MKLISTQILIIGVLLCVFINKIKNEQKIGEQNVKELMRNREIDDKEREQKKNKQYSEKYEINQQEILTQIKIEDQYFIGKGSQQEKQDQKQQEQENIEIDEKASVLMNNQYNREVQGISQMEELAEIKIVDLYYTDEGSKQEKQGQIKEGLLESIAGTIFDAIIEIIIQLL